ncbi:MAG: hypothetical protein BGO29_06235 [Bacteroidales bacterium 36-12]|nr:MAG: hypothetical protein BGO29_06235 [Bacteroidales bacterium 36-12]
MRTKKLLSIIVAVILMLPVSSSAASQLFSRYPTGSGAEKQVVSIHTYSSHTKWQEGAINMLFPDANVNEDKWCDNSSAEPWVIFELANYYNIDKFEITDAQIREKTNGNIQEYKIFVTTKAYDPVIAGWEDSDWVEVYHGQDEGSLTVKTIELDAPVEARYVKFYVLNKGYRADNGNYENAVRVYGFDMYGEFSREVDRGNLVSVGKTILKFEEKPSNRREWAYNILDGNTTNGNSKWGIPGYGQVNNYHYVVIDLEEMFDITDFKLYDASYAESGTKNLDGVNIYVSTVAPNLGLINMVDDDTNDCWTQLVSSEYESTLNLKEYTYNPSDPLWKTPVHGRFIKLEIPAMKAPEQDPNAFTRIFQFEVYGDEIFVPEDDATLSLLSVSEGVLSPNFVSDVTDYTVNVAKEIESLTVAASPTNKEATVTGAGVKPLVIGDNPFAIQVTSKDGTATKTYNLTINRAAQSKISTLKSLNPSAGVLYPTFNPDSVNYYLDIPYGTNSVTLAAVATQADAVIAGLGEKTLSGDIETLTVMVTSEDGTKTKEYNITVVPEEEGLFSVSYGKATGKRIVNVHSWSGYTNGDENPYKTLIGNRLNTNGSTKNKWCENTNDAPWIILSITDIYHIDRVVIRDGLLVESSNANVANVSGYMIQVSTTGTEDEDFTVADENYYDYGESPDIKDIPLSVDARYIKFTFYRGYKPSDNSVAGAVWIYGIDLYGNKVETVDRDGVVSVGKTIVSHHNNYSDRETPCNIIDGNINYYKENYETGEINTIKHDPWAFNRSAGDGWVIIDLEGNYDITGFKLYDAADWITGYDVFVSATGAEGSWTEAFSGEFEKEYEEVMNDNFEMVEVVVGPDPKEAILETPVTGRFVKLSIPLAMQSTNFNRIREFEVYGTPASSGVLSPKSKSESFVIYPNPVEMGSSLYLNEEGLLSVYTLQGSLVYEKAVEGATHVSTGMLVKGSYVVRLSNANGVKQAKLIVK